MSPAFPLFKNKNNWLYMHHISMCYYRWHAPMCSHRCCSGPCLLTCRCCRIASECSDSPNPLLKTAISWPVGLKLIDIQSLTSSLQTVHSNPREHSQVFCRGTNWAVYGILLNGFAEVQKKKSWTCPSVIASVYQPHHFYVIEISFQICVFKHVNVGELDAEPGTCWLC